MTGRPAAGCKPVRVQRKRTKGWKMPPNTRYCGRPTVYGNPYIGRLPDGTDVKARSVRRHKEWLDGKREHRRNPIRPSKAMIISDLRGLNLACWCGLDEPCHVDYLLEIANA